MTLIQPNLNFGCDSSHSYGNLFLFRIWESLEGSRRTPNERWATMDSSSSLKGTMESIF